MPYFAQINDQNVVQQVLSITQDEINTGNWGDPAQWVQTSYNTHGGVYYTPNSNPPAPDPDQSKAFRLNYAGIGYTYDPALNGFCKPQPYASWILDTSTGWWNAPVPYPTDGLVYGWNEATVSWVLADPQPPGPVPPPTTNSGSAPNVIG
jgi:hypothetical protein